MKINQVKAGAALSYLSIILNTIIGLCFTPFMLLRMGQSEYGLYSLAASIVGYLTILDFGFGNAIIRYTAKYRALNQKDKEYNLNGMFLIIFIGIGVITSLIGLILYMNVGSIFSVNMTSHEINKARILILLLIFNLAVSFPLGIFTSIITAYEKFVFIKLLSIVRSIISPCIMIPLLVLGYRSIGMVVATSVLNISVLLINMWFCLSKLRIKIHIGSFDPALLKEIIGYSFFIFLGIIVDKINWSADQFILGAVAGTTTIAIYAVALQINTYYLMFSTSISSVFLPKLTAMITKKVSKNEISDLFIRIGRIQFIVMAYILSTFILIGHDFLIAWAGKNYSQAYIIILILIIPVTVPLTQNLGITILQAENKQKFRSVALISVAILNIAISVILARKYQGIGCAIGTGVGLTIGNIIMMNIYYYRVTKINIPRYWKEIFLMTIPVVISSAFSYFVLHLFNGTGYVNLLLKGTIITVIYIPTAWFFMMKKNERELFGLPIRKAMNYLSLSKRRLYDR